MTKHMSFQGHFSNKDPMGSSLGRSQGQFRCPHLALRNTQSHAGSAPHFASWLTARFYFSLSSLKSSKESSAFLSSLLFCSDPVPISGFVIASLGISGQWMTVHSCAGGDTSVLIAQPAAALTTCHSPFTHSTLRCSVVPSGSVPLLNSPPLLLQPWLSPWVSIYFLHP